MKNHSEKSLWVIFSKYIRARDADDNGYCRCISCCLTENWKKMDAGHYIAQGSSYALKYNENNVNAQCTSCNKFKSGNLINYRIGLVNKIGEKAVKNLEAIYQMKKISKKLNQLELNELYKLYNNKFKELESKKNLC